MNDQAWLNELTTELRLRGVSGADIGDALAQVESHCAESGESATQAFGSPRAYAQQLDLDEASDQRLDAQTLSTIVAATVSGFVGVMLTGALVRAWPSGQLVEVSWGVLLVAAFLAAIVLTARSWIEAVFRSRWVALGGFALAFVLATLAIAKLDAPALSLPPLLALAIAVLLLGASVVLNLRIGTDELRDPRTGDQPRRKGVALLGRLQPWLWVIFAVLIAALNLLG